MMGDTWKVYGTVSDLLRSYYHPDDKLGDLLSSFLKAYQSTTNSIADAVSLALANGQVQEMKLEAFVTQDPRQWPCSEPRLRAELLEVSRQVMARAAAHDSRKYLSIPIFYHNRPIGALAVLRDEGKIWELSERILLECLAAHLAYQIKRYEVRDAAQQKLGRDIMMIGISEALEKVDCHIEKAAMRDELALIQGETGTGKELVAHAVHLLSARRDQPLITVNCAALPRELAESELLGHVKGAFTGATQDRRGYFEEADGGTIFLDEIGELDRQIQAKLLRVIETGELQKVGESRTRKRVDVRVLVATSRDLKQMAREGTFNEALLSRLDALRIQVPPLRNRKEDIPHLVTYFLGKFAGSESALTVSTEVMEVFRKYHWPHNVRELRNTIARLVTFSDGPTIGLKDLYEECPELIESVQAAERELNGQGLTCRTSCQQARAIAQEHERQQLMKALIKHDWNITRAAKELNTYQQYLSKRMKKLGIKKPSQKK